MNAREWRKLGSMEAASPWAAAAEGQGRECHPAAPPAQQPPPLTIWPGGCLYVLCSGPVRSPTAQGQ